MEDNKIIIILLCVIIAILVVGVVVFSQVTKEAGDKRGFKSLNCR